MIKPVKSKNHAISVISTSSPFDTKRLHRSIKRWNEEGIAIHFSKNFKNREVYLAGSLQDRLSDLKWALYEQNTPIMSTRGGFGASMLLPYLKELSPPSEWHLFCGFSDLTALHLFFNMFWDATTLHSPNFLGAVEQPEEVKREIISYIKSEIPNDRFDRLIPVFKGEAEGKLVGGNLKVLCSLCGTPYMPDLRDTILILEDTNEKPYSIHRSLLQLQQCGVFKKVSAVIFGDLGIEMDLKKSNLNQSEFLRWVLSDVKIPVYTGLPIGHGLINRPILLGINYRLTEDGILSFHSEGVFHEE